MAESKTSSFGGFWGHPVESCYDLPGVGKEGEIIFVTNCERTFSYMGGEWVLFADSRVALCDPECRKKRLIYDLAWR